MTLSRWLTIAALGATVGCQQAETPEQAMARMEQETAAARTAIEAKAAQFAAHFSAGHMDTVAAMYVEDAEVLAPNAPAVSGRDNIRTFFADFAAMGTPTLSLTVQAVSASGPHAVERGTYTLAFTPGPNAPREVTAVNDTGKYLVHWVMEGGQWLIAHDIWNSDLPPPPPPAPTRR
jgi:ketosteroid isomerase-like protein